MNYEETELGANMARVDLGRTKMNGNVTGLDEENACSAMSVGGFGEIKTYKASSSDLSPIYAPDVHFNAIAEQDALTVTYFRPR